jgi:hypothetical protein
MSPTVRNQQFHVIFTTVIVTVVIVGTTTSVRPDCSRQGSAWARGQSPLSLQMWTVSRARVPAARSTGAMGSRGSLQY